MFKTIKRWANWNYTAYEKYLLWETTFFNKKLEEKPLGKLEKLEVENMFLKMEKQRLYVKNILSH